MTDPCPEKHGRSWPWFVRAACRLALLLAVFGPSSCDGDLNPILEPVGDSRATDGQADGLIDGAPDGTVDGPGLDVPAGETPPACLALTGQVCRTAECGSYQNCAQGLGACEGGKHCCEGACTE